MISRRRKLLLFGRGDAYDPSASALFARMTTQPSGARKTIINNLIVGLKADGIWSLLDVFVVPAAHDSQAGLLNWISTSFNGTAVNSPTFTADRGFTGDGISMYINSNWIPATNGVNFVQNDASFGCYLRTDVNALQRDMGCVNGTSFMNITGRTTGNYNLAVNSNSSANSATANSLGFFSGTRVDAANFKHWKNGVELQNNVIASTAPVSVRSMFVLALNSAGSPLNPSTRQSAMYFTGAGSINQLTLFNHIETYMDAIGAGVV